MCVRYPEQRKHTGWHAQGETEAGKSNFISALALADFSVTSILMALPLATTEHPTCNYSLVIKTKNGVCQNRATPFWAADNSPRLAICSAALTSGKATFLLPLVLVVSLQLLLFPSRPSPLPWSSCLFCFRLYRQQCHSSWALRRANRCSSCHTPASRWHGLSHFIPWNSLCGMAAGQFGVKRDMDASHGAGLTRVAGPCAAGRNRTFRLWGWGAQSSHFSGGLCAIDKMGSGDWGGKGPVGPWLL